MAETVFLDWMLSLGVGLLFGRFATHAPSSLRSRALAFGVLVQAALMTVSVWLYLLSPDWMWMYWVNPASLPGGIVVLAFAMYVVAFLAGFLLAAEVAPSARTLWWGLLGVTAVAITGLEVAAWDRLSTLGTFAQFAANSAHSLDGDFKLVLGAGGAIVVVLTVLGLARVARPASAPV